MNKKVLLSALMALVLIVASVTSALAYGTTTKTVNGTTYTIKDSYSKTSTAGKVGGTAKCTISPTADHYSTSDIRANSSSGKVYATSGRCWVYGGATSTASCTANAQSDLLGYGWWGGLS